VHGLFYGAPWHDVPALLAFMTALVTTVNFVVSVDVNFYPKYRNHYSLYNDKGTIKDIKQSEKEMLDTLKTEIFYTSLKQLLFTAACTALGGYLLDLLPLGFNEVMRGYFRTLCVAYGLYAIGNMLMLILLYFTDYKGACISTAVFAGATILLTVVSLLFPYIYYGFGFLLAALIFVVTTALRLDYFTKHLPFYILSVQPLVAEDRSGRFTRLGLYLEEKLERGVTYLDGEGYYSGNKTKVILSVVKRQQLAEIKQLVVNLDPDAFIIVQEAHQVLGDGFSRYTKDSL
jgi:uncharacterized membrane protein